MLAPSTARMLELTSRLRRRTVLTAASSEPDWCARINCQLGAVAVAFAIGGSFATHVRRTAPGRRRGGRAPLDDDRHRALVPAGARRSSAPCVAVLSRSVAA